MPSRERATPSLCRARAILAQIEQIEKLAAPDHVRIGHAALVEAAARAEWNNRLRLLCESRRHRAIAPALCAADRRRRTSTESLRLRPAPSRWWPMSLPSLPAIIRGPFLSRRSRRGKSPHRCSRSCRRIPNKDSSRRRGNEPPTDSEHPTESQASGPRPSTGAGSRLPNERRARTRCVRAQARVKSA